MSDTERERRRTERWQRALLPLISRMLVGLTVFFFVVSLGQIVYLHWRMEQAAGIDLAIPFERLAKVARSESSEAMNAANAMVMARLEVGALDRRYHQASVVLMARVWTSYLGFVTGMILALVGAAFTLGRVQETPTSVEAKGGGVGGALETSAPGIVLATLGVVLMVATLFVRYEITVSDSAIYSGSLRRLAGESPAGPPPISFPSPSPVADPVKKDH